MPGAAVPFLVSLFLWSKVSDEFDIKSRCWKDGSGGMFFSMCAWHIKSSSAMETV